MSENEYIPRNPEPIPPTEKKTTSRTATKPNDKPNDKPKGNALNKFSGLNIKKVRTITGSLLTLTAVFLFIMFINVNPGMRWLNKLRVHQHRSWF